MADWHGNPGTLVGLIPWLRIIFTWRLDLKKSLPMLAYAIIFLVFIQAAGTLVESIYILDLMHTTLDAKVLGLLFFLAPLLLVPFARKSPRPLAWLTFAVLLAARGCCLSWTQTTAWWRLALQREPPSACSC